MEDSLTQYGTGSTGITEYEEERNQRKKALHDAVEKDLRAAGFAEAASLRSAFSVQRSGRAEDSEAQSKKTRRRKHAPPGDALLCRRYSRRLSEAHQKLLPSTATTSAPEEVAQTFQIWTRKKPNPEMKSKKPSSKKRVPESSDQEKELMHEDSEVQEPGRLQSKENVASASHDTPPAFSEVVVRDDSEPRRMQSPEGAPRPQMGGYRAPDLSRRGPLEWGEEYRMPYGSTSSIPFTGSFRRPWSPAAYDGGRDFDSRGPQYANRGRQYDERSDYIDRRELLYDGRGRDFDMRERQLEDQRRYEDSRYERRPVMPADVYSRAIPTPTAGTAYLQSNRPAGSPPPPSSRNATDSAKQESPGRRPLYLNNVGVPTGRMATVFHADLVSFVKDMDPTEGWEKQSTAEKDRLRERLMHDYEFYGDSTRLSDKWLKKKTGAALIQYRYNINQLIDKGVDRPSDVHPDYWDELVKRRGSTEAKEKSEQMANIARARVQTKTTKRALEQTVMLQLASDLKREPYDTEIKAAVEKQWSVLQEETAERKRVRATTTTSIAALQSNKDLERRLVMVEAFMHKWEPHMEVWKENIRNGNGKMLPPCTGVPESFGKELACLPESGEGVGVMADDENDNDSTDDEQRNEKCKSSGDEETESDSEDEKQSSEDEEDKEEQSHAVNVVEPEEPIAKVGKTKKSVMNVSAAAQLRTNTAVGATKQRSSSADGTKLGGPMPSTTAGTGAQHLAKVVVPDEVQVIGKGKEKEADKDSRPRKRVKVTPNSVLHLLESEEEEAREIPKKVDNTAKNLKTPRRNEKSANAKVDTKGGKGMAITPGDMMLLENTEPRKFLGVGSIVHSEFDRDVVFMPGLTDRKLVRLRLKRVIFPSAPLAYVEMDDEGKVECKTLGEAFRKQCIIWWPAPAEV